MPGVSAGEGTAKPLCNRRQFETHSFLVCDIDLAKGRLQLAWKRGDGGVIGSLRGLEAEVSSMGKRLRFAMNAGMFKPDFSPVGLYIEAARELVPLDAGSGGGNFHLQPNGVLYWSNANRSAGVMETATFQVERPKAEFATQSGPMLVVDGGIHPRFEPGSQSRKIRNGAGVGAPGHILLVISEEAATSMNSPCFSKLA